MAANSIVTKTGDGVTTDFTFSFTGGYIDESHVYCQVAEEVDGTGSPVYRDITFLSEGTIRVGGDVPELGAEVQISRRTPIITSINDFADGDVLTSDNLDLSFDQLVKFSQELEDSLSSARSAEGNAILAQQAYAAAVAARDLAEQYRDNSEAAKDVALLAQSAAETAQTASEAAQTAAATSASASSTSASQSDASATAASASETAAATSASQAATSASNAAADATAAANASSSAAASAIAASDSATAAQAAEAEAEAHKDAVLGQDYVSKVVLNSGSNLHKFVPVVESAMFYGGNNTSTVGAIEIEINEEVADTNTMLSFDVLIGNYNAATGHVGQTRYSVTGYLLATSDAWATPVKARCEGVDTPLTVRFRYDAATGKGYVYLGELDQNWSFLGVTIQNLMIRATGAIQSGWDDAMTVNVVTAFKGTASQSTTAVSLGGLPSGGTAGQALTKIDGTDGSVAWSDVAGAGFVGVSLKEVMDIHYGVGAWTYFGGTGVGSDIYAAITNYRTNVNTASYLTIFVDYGSYRIAIAGTKAMCDGLKLVGAGIIGCTLNYDRSDGFMWYVGGTGGRTGGELSNFTILLWAGGADTTAWCIYSSGDATDQAGYFRLRNLNITSSDNSYWYRIVEMNGDARTSPQGTRVIFMENVTGFNAHNFGMLFTNAVTVISSFLALYTGKNNGNDIQIYGGGASNLNTIKFFLRAMDIGGRLNVYNCSQLDISGSCGTATIAATVTRSIFNIQCPSVSDSSTGNIVNSV